MTTQAPAPTDGILRCFPGGGVHPSAAPASPHLPCALDQGTRPSSTRCHGGRCLLAAAALTAVLFCGDARADPPAPSHPGVATQEMTGQGDPRHRVEEAIRTAERWIEAGEPERALALLRRLVRVARAEGLDATAIRFQAAQALLRMRRPAEAAAILGLLVESRPEVDRFQLDYAAALFALGRDDEARAVFRKVRRRESLPPVVRSNVERYLERIRARQRLQIDLDLGFWRDDNVNNAPERETVQVPLFGARLPFRLNERPVGAWVGRTGVRVRWRQPITDSRRVYIETQGSVARNTALGASAYNRTWASLSVGPRLGYPAWIAGRERPGLIRADLGAERRWRGGDAYAASLWARLGAEQAINDDWRIGGSVLLWFSRYDGEGRDRNPHGRSLGLHVGRRIGSGWLTAGGTLSREKPRSRSRRWTSYEASLSYAANLGRDWRLSARSRLAETTFGAADPVFLTRRQDRTRGLDLTVSHRSLAWEGYLPEITLSWARTTSSIELYDRELRSVRVGLRRLF